MRTSKLALLSNAPRKIISVVIGYHVWLIMGSWLPTRRSLEVPLCFYNVQPHINIHAPEIIKITLTGDRTDLYHLDTQRLAVHIDTQPLAIGCHALTISREHLLLPRNIHVAHQSPSNLSITVQRNELET